MAIIQFITFSCVCFRSQIDLIFLCFSSYIFFIYRFFSAIFFQFVYIKLNSTDRIVEMIFFFRVVVDTIREKNRSVESTTTGGMCIDIETIDVRSVDTFWVLNKLFRMRLRILIGRAAFVPENRISFVDIVVWEYSICFYRTSFHFIPFVLRMLLIDVLQIIINDDRYN